MLIVIITLLLFSFVTAQNDGSYTFVGNAQCSDQNSNPFSYIQFSSFTDAASCASKCKDYQTSIGFNVVPSTVCECLFDVSLYMIPYHTEGYDTFQESSGSYPITSVTGSSAYSCYKFDNPYFGTVSPSYPTFVNEGQCIGANFETMDYSGYNSITTVDGCRNKCYAYETCVGFEFYPTSSQCYCLFGQNYQTIPNDGDTNSTTSIGTYPIVGVTYSANTFCYKFDFPDWGATNSPTPAPTLPPTPAYTLVGNGQCRDSIGNYYDYAQFPARSSLGDCAYICSTSLSVPGFLFISINKDCWCYIDNTHQHTLSGYNNIYTTYTGEGAISTSSGSPTQLACYRYNTFTLGNTYPPVAVPSASPTLSPTSAPSTTPTISPTLSPSASPSVSPSTTPTADTAAPSVSPTGSPTLAPSPYYTYVGEDICEDSSFRWFDYVLKNGITGVEPCAQYCYQFETCIGFGPLDSSSDSCRCYFDDVTRTFPNPELYDVLVTGNNGRYPIVRGASGSTPSVLKCYVFNPVIWDGASDPPTPYPSLAPTQTPTQSPIPFYTTTYLDYYGDEGGDTGSTCVGFLSGWLNLIEVDQHEFRYVVLRGSENPTGYECRGSVADQIVRRMINGTGGSTYSCDGNTWYVRPPGCGTLTIGVNSSPCDCDTGISGGVLRPCIGNDNLGGIDTATCSSSTHPQYVELTFASEYQSPASYFPTAAPVPSPTASPTIFLPAFTYIGDGHCLDSNGNSFDYVYKLGSITRNDCARLCYSFDTSIGFRQPNSNNECICYFSEHYQVIPGESFRDGWSWGGTGVAPITGSTGVWSTECYAFDTINWGVTPSPSVSPTGAPTGSPTTPIPSVNPTVSPSNSPSVSPTVSPTTSPTPTPVYSYVGEGRCTDTNGNLFDTSYYTAPTNLELCSTHCLQFPTCIGFHFSNNYMSCECYFSNHYQTQPDAGQVTGFLWIYDGEYPITGVQSEPGRWCYRFNNVDWGVTTSPSSSPSVSPTNSPVVSPEPTMSPSTTPTVSPTDSPTVSPTIGPYQYVGEGRCTDSSGNKFDMSYYNAPTNLALCSAHCSQFITCIGFTFSNNYLSCECIFSNDHQVKPSSSAVTGFTWIYDGVYPVTGTDGQLSIWCYKFTDVSWGPTNSPTVSPTNSPTKSPNNLPQPTATPSLSPTQSPTFIVPQYTLIGNGVCRAADNWEYDMVWINNPQSKDHCAYMCKQFITCIGFVHYNNNAQCHCLFSSHYQVFPDPSQYDGKIDAREGNYPIATSVGSSVTCNEFDTVDWGTNTPSISPTGSPLTPIPSKSPTTPTLNPTLSPTTYEYLGVGKCEDASNNLYDLHYVLGSSSPSDCSMYCESIPSTIGFELTPESGGGYKDCACYFDNINRGTLPSPYQDYHLGRYPIDHANLVNGRYCYAFNTVSFPTTSPSRSPLPAGQTHSPTNSPSVSPTGSPSRSPTGSPTGAPVVSPTVSPTISPTRSPTWSPTISPTASPSVSPSASPTQLPSRSPLPFGQTHTPTSSPSTSPSITPSVSPSMSPSTTPTVSPSVTPTVSPSSSPTGSPTTSPSAVPSVAPSESPTGSPSRSPLPFGQTHSPTGSPTKSPSASPTSSPSTSPSTSPTTSPSVTPTSSPSSSPTVFVKEWFVGNGMCVDVNNLVYDTAVYYNYPHRNSCAVKCYSLPTSVGYTHDSNADICLCLFGNTNRILPTDADILITSYAGNPPITGVITQANRVCYQFLENMPTNSPTLSPTMAPSVAPTGSPSVSPSVSPTDSPSLSPSVSPSGAPSISPTLSPSGSPSVSPTFSPSTSPVTMIPTSSPTKAPSDSPTSSPSMAPTYSAGPHEFVGNGYCLDEVGRYYDQVYFNVRNGTDVDYW